MILLICGDLLVRGAIVLAKKLNVPALFIGLTIVAFGTSAPELVVGIQTALSHPDIIGLAVGNVVGSNIANVLLGLGLPALFFPVLAGQPMIRRNAGLMIAATVLFIYFCWDSQITLVEGGTLFGLIIAYLVYSALRAGRTNDTDFSLEEVEEVENMTGPPHSNQMILVYIAVAIVGLPIGAHITVQGGVSLATLLDVSPAIIGLTVIALGTSLPEIVTTLVAVFHRHSAVAIGNIIGSNIFNLLGIMGVTTLVAVPANGGPIILDPEFLSFDLWIMLGTAAMILPYAWTRGRIGRFSAIGFIIAYAAFIFIIFQNSGAFHGGVVGAP